LPVTASLFAILFQLKLTKLKLKALKSDFSAKMKYMNADKIAINWQNFAESSAQVCFYNTAHRQFL